MVIILNEKKKPGNENDGKNLPLTDRKSGMHQILTPT